MGKTKKLTGLQRNKALSSVSLMALFSTLPNISSAAGVDGILLLPASWLLALILAIISIAISNKKLLILYIHLGSAAFYIFAKLVLLPGLLGLFEFGDIELVIGFAFLILYPLLLSCCILLLSVRWRSLAKRESGEG